MGKESPVLGTWVYTGLEEDGQGQHRRPSLGDWKKMRRVWQENVSRAECKVRCVHITVYCIWQLVMLTKELYGKRP